MPKLLSMPITSPVERISGPSWICVPGKRSKGMTASFTALYISFGSSVKFTSFKESPVMIFAAMPATLRPVAFETKGTVLDARGFASMTYTLPL